MNCTHYVTIAECLRHALIHHFLDWLGLHPWHPPHGGHPWKP